MIDARVVLVGPGAIGTTVAARIAPHVAELYVLAREAAVPALQAGGLVAKAPSWEARAHPRVVKSLDHVHGDVDAILLATRIPEAERLAPALAKRLVPGGALVCLQNGLVARDIDRALPVGVVVGCMIGWSATRTAPGLAEVTSEGEFAVGAFRPGNAEAVELARALLGHVFPTRATPNILGALYSKLVVNSCMNSLGAIAGLTLGGLLARGDARDLFLRIGAEAVAVADAHGIEMETIGGIFHPRRFMLGPAPWPGERAVKHLLLRAISRKYAKARPSALQAIERGEPTEIPWLNGEIVRLGRAKGVPTPVNQRILDVVAELEARKLTPGPGNLKLLA